MRRSTAAAMVAAALLASAPPALAATYTFNVPLSPSQTGLPSNPDGSGTAVITMSDATNQVCWTYAVSNVGAVSSAGIYEGARGQPASPVPLIPFNAASGCSLAPGAIAVMARCPAQFNVTVRTLQYPAGALRGQLGSTCSI